MGVTIRSVLNGTLADIENRRYNIFVPISLGNPFFTRRTVREFTLWALERTKDKVAILVADKLAAINYQVLRGLSEEESVAAAMQEGDKFLGMAERVIRSLPADQQPRVAALRWEDIESGLRPMQDSIRSYYAENQNFKRQVHDIVHEMLGTQVPNDTDSVDKLGMYVIDEMPLMFKGMTHGSTTYEIFVYPGLSGIDHLVANIQNGAQFPDLADRLQLTSLQPNIEAYVE